MSYRRAANLISEFLPLPEGVSHTTVRRHTLAAGRQLDERAQEPDEYDSLEPRRKQMGPAQHITVAIDGTYVRSTGENWKNELYVVAGRIERDGVLSGRFAWVADGGPMQIRYMKATLDDHGFTPESTVAVLADGADGLRGIVRGGADRTPHSILDWFHISMRLRAIEQMGPKTADLMTDPATVTLLREKLPGLRYQMWHGQWEAASTRMRDMYQGVGRCLAMLNGADSDRATRFCQHLLDLRDYLINNQTSLICYAKARQEGMRISSAPAESNMAHVINQRMGKRQPMCWSPEGANLLLQVRCALLDGRLEALFREWHPQFRKVRAR
jgi:hypothetical protein